MKEYGFEAALSIDNEVWKVLPRVQARLLKDMTGLDKGIEGLFDAFTTKLALEGYTFQAGKTETGTGFKVTIEKCPWHDLMLKSSRENLSRKVGSLICNSTYAAWASVFSDNIIFILIQLGRKTVVYIFVYVNLQQWVSLGKNSRCQ